MVGSENLGAAAVVYADATALTTSRVMIGSLSSMVHACPKRFLSSSESAVRTALASTVASSTGLMLIHPHFAL